MAYINLAGGLKINTADAVDSRLVLTKAEMKSLHYANDESRPANLRGKIFQLPSNYLCVCSEDNKIYVYNALNEEDALTGKFRKVESDGGDIWLDITSYVSENASENTMSISQEGYDLIYNTFYPASENPVNKYVGILINGYKLIFNSLIDSDLTDIKGFDFISYMVIDGVKGYIKATVYNTKRVEVIDEMDSSSNKIWYELDTASKTITQNQYDELTTLINGNKLAGIKDPTLGAYYPLGSEDNGTFRFGVSGLGNTGSKYNVTQWDITIKSDLSVSNNLKIKYIPVLPEHPASQCIISIKSGGYQENLSIGNGLEIKNATLQATGGGQSIKDLPVVELTSTSATITDETVKAKILENVNKDNYLICKLKMDVIEILITRDYKLVPNDEIKSTVYTQAVFIDLGIVAGIFVFTLSINSEDGTITVSYVILDYVKNNKVSLFLKPSGSFGVTTDYGDTNMINGLELYFDTINGNPIIHSDNTANNYNIPTITFED